MPAGRPPKYESADELQEKIKEYFETGVKKRQVEVGRGDSKMVVEIPVPTITGLVLHCGFADRISFYDYEKRDEFSYTIKRARTFIENEYEEQLALGSTSAIFALKNFGWTDKTEIEQYGKDGGPIEFTNTERAARLATLLERGRQERDRQPDSD